MVNSFSKKSANTIQWIKYNLINKQYVLEKMDIHLFKRMNLDPHFILHIKVLTQNESKV